MQRIITTILITILLLVFGCRQKSADENSEKVVRHGWVIKVKPEKLEEYKNFHANVWPGVAKVINECNIRNYSIYHRDGYLFSYLEYTGNDWDADMKKMAADSLTQEWWKLTDPCQEKIETASEDEWWATMEEVFHLN
ncbi:MAG: L-rhamnose mutarotase [Bacteroidota bacterium]